MVVFQEQCGMVRAIEADLFHCVEFLVFGHLGALDFAPDVVEVRHFELVGHSLLVFLTVEDSREDLQLIDRLERQFDDCAGHAHLLEALHGF